LSFRSLRGQSKAEESASRDMPTALHPAAIDNAAKPNSRALRLSSPAQPLAQLADRAFLRITGSDPRAGSMAWSPTPSSRSRLARAATTSCSTRRAASSATAPSTARQMEGPQFLLETDAPQLEAIQKHLTTSSSLDDVELSPVTGDRAGLLLAGRHAVSPPAEARLSCRPVADAPTTIDAPETALRSTSSTATRRSCRASNSGPTRPPSPRSPLHLPQRTPLSSLLPPSKAYRILSGIPRYGIDIRNTEEGPRPPAGDCADSRVALHQGLATSVRRSSSASTLAAAFIAPSPLSSSPEPCRPQASNSPPNPRSAL